MPVYSCSAGACKPRSGCTTLEGCLALGSGVVNEGCMVSVSQL